MFFFRSISWGLLAEAYIFVLLHYRTPKQKTKVNQFKISEWLFPATLRVLSFLMEI
jgi:hypothetical protein